MRKKPTLTDLVEAAHKAGMTVTPHLVPNDDWHDVVQMHVEIAAVAMHRSKSDIAKQVVLQHLKIALGILEK